MTTLSGLPRAGLPGLPVESSSTPASAAPPAAPAQAKGLIGRTWDAYKALPSKVLLGAHTVLSLGFIGFAGAGAVQTALSFHNPLIGGAVAALEIAAAPLLVYAGYQAADASTYPIHAFLDQADPDKVPAMADHIRDFQNHHDHPNDVRSHTFMQDIRPIITPMLPMSAALLAINPNPAIAMLWLGLTHGALLAQEMHKMSHSPPSEQPKYVKALRTLKMAIENKAHGAHHRSPRNDNYCVLSGVNNGWMDKLGIGDGIVSLMRKADLLYDGGLPRWKVEEQIAAEKKAAYKKPKADE